MDVRKHAAGAPQTQPDNAPEMDHDNAPGELNMDYVENVVELDNADRPPPLGENDSEHGPLGMGPRPMHGVPDGNLHGSPPRPPTPAQPRLPELILFNFHSTSRILLGVHLSSLRSSTPTH